MLINSDLKLSILTINLNNKAGLLKTLVSVINQTFTDYEFFVIDGASNDGSVDLIKQYVDNITYWVSEPDNGIYHAMNKGINACSGEYILFLNSGDELINNEILDEIFIENHNEEVIFGDITYFDPNNNNMLITSLPDELDLFFFYKQSLWHQASFIRKSLFERTDLYNETNKYISDWQFFFESIIYEGATYKNLKKLVTKYDMVNGISVKSVEESNNEKQQVLKAKLDEQVLDLLRKHEKLLNQLDEILKSDKFLLYRTFEKHNFLSKLNLFFIKTLVRLRNILK